MTKDNQNMRRVVIGVAAVCLAAVLALIGVYYWTRMREPEEVKAPDPKDFAAVAGAQYAREDDPIATLTMEDGGVIRLRLYPAAAPNTVANFVTLANQGFYDGLTFHRAASGILIQGGDPAGNGTGGPGYAISGEFASNGVENNLSHVRGVISMARAVDKNSAGSQFFLMRGDFPGLDGDYAAFGEVVSGIEKVDEIASMETDAMERIANPPVIRSITVETNGVEYVVQKIE